MTRNIAAETRPGLAARTLGAAMWSVAAFVASRVITLVSTIVIARLLGPDDFGLFAIVLVVLSVADAATVSSLNDAVQWDRDRRLHERAALGLSVAVGVAVTVLAIVSAPLVARAFDQPRLTLMLVAVAPIPFVAHLCLVAVVAEPAVRVVFGTQWLAVATPMRWIALAFAVDALVLGASAALKAAGRSGIVGGVISGKLALLASLLWWAAGRGLPRRRPLSWS